MSRIGKLPITIPQGTNVTISKTNEVIVKGPLGELKQQVDPCITVEVEDNILSLKRPTEQKNHKAMHGLYRSLLANMIKGVSEGFTITQELVGTGYRAQATEQTLTLALGYSHSIVFELAKEIKVETIAERGKNPIIKLSSHDKQLLAQVAAKIRSYRKPEPYKGKGILYQGEVVRRKAGKSADK